MKKQTYSNHRRYHLVHHFILIPALGVLMLLALAGAYLNPDQLMIWLFLSILSAAVLSVLIMMRQQYALKNQNRIIRLEFRLRHFELTGKSSKEAEEKITFHQIAALRFADDDQFISLLEKILSKNLSADEIKKSITNWQGDYMRV